MHSVVLRNTNVTYIVAQGDAK